MNIIQMGAGFYLSHENELHRLNYAQYLTLCEFENGSIVPEQITDRLSFHEHQHEHVICPLCGGGKIRRDLAGNLVLLTQIHDGLLHADLEAQRTAVQPLEN